MLHLLAGEVGGAQVHQHQVVVRAARHQIQPALHDGLGQDGGVLDDLLLIGLELGLEGLAQGHRLGGDDVLQGAALGAGEDGGVELLGDGLIVAQEHAAPGAPEGLVGGGGHHVGIGDGGGVAPGGHQAGDVGHVHEQIGAHLVGDVGEGLEVDDPGVGGGAGQDHAGLVLSGQVPHLVVVDAAVLAQAVGHHVVVLARKIHRGAVGQVSALVQAHAKHRVPVLAQGLIDGEVGLGAGVGLHVGVIGAEEFLCPLDGDVLHHVHALAAAVVALAGVALGVLVGEDGAGGGQDGGADDVLRGDELDVLLLPVILGTDGLPHLRVGGGDKVHDFCDQWEHSFFSDSARHPGGDIPYYNRPGGNYNELFPQFFESRAGGNRSF